MPFFFFFFFSHFLVWWNCRKPVALDPSTDEFYRDAGVRLTTPGTMSGSNNFASSIKNSAAAKSQVATGPESSRIPSIQASRLRPPLKSSAGATTLPHFGIARGVQQVQPQPSIAYGVTVAPPMRRDVRRPASNSAQSLSPAKSRSQENLNVPPKPRAARPVSTCLGSNDLLSASKHHSPFIRNRHRASIGGTASFSSHKHVAPPIATLPPVRSSEPTPTKWGVSRPSLGKLTGVSTSSSSTTTTTGSVKLSDMKNAMPITPVTARKLSTTSDFHSIQFRRKQPAADKLEESAVQMMESLELSTTRLRKPQAAAAISKLVTSTTTSTATPPESSPMPRRNPWRRSLHFTTATSSPPPPPPRKNFATLPKSAHSSAASSSSVGSNNNNNNNNNNLHHNPNPSSKLPVPAFKRNSHLGSNF